ncbi:MAG: hypothetical protein CVU31_16505 [Betaproteobacteria bacterium HGW-Betaproteobacteria-4]|jgi:hypothetical protein|nr:MAG: hypothetical protein CVU31_16505 [Betaproteobacteria bacterium HGW-Betaproteobacteria-4]
MHNKARSPFSGAPPANGGLATSYLVHAVVLCVSAAGNSLDDGLLGKLVRRRLSRLERVLDAHGGTLLRPLPQGLLAAFDTAEAAVLVACEMQRRCAVIPQIMETQIGLKIGIHPASAGQDQGAAENAAAQLAMLLGAGSIVASAKVVATLPEILREKTSVIAGENIGVAAHLVDWGAIPMRPAPAPAKRPKASAGLVLRHGENIYRFDGKKSVITIGRDPGNDVVISAAKASRQHCRIIHRLDHHVLIDLSMNGTFVKSGDAPEKTIRKQMVTLPGSGLISFGQSCQIDGTQVFVFEIG